ncbi:tail fiber domain-containing protein [Flavilitoribacter nigricans]|nr:tail fiber domain-containing protein [Flavilitoribacter nigricans]
MKPTLYLFLSAIACLSHHQLFAQKQMKMDTAAIRFIEGGAEKAFMKWTGSDLFIQNDETNGGDIYLDAEQYVILKANELIQSQAPRVSLSGQEIDLQSSVADITLSSGRAIRFMRGSSTRMYMNDFGTGMGTTSPERLLHLESNLQNNFDPQLRLSRGSGYFDLDGATNFRIFNANGLQFIIDGEGDNEGNTGIGTSAPLRKLHLLTNPSAAQLRLADPLGYFDLYASADFLIQDEGGTRLFIKGSTGTAGNVGIGNTNPQRKLHLQTTASPQLRLQDAGGSIDLYGGADFVVRNSGGINRLVVRGTGPILASNLSNIGDFRNMQYNDVTGEIGYDNSSRRDKRNIRELQEDFNALLEMQPKTYTRPWAPDRQEIGFIAEDFHDRGLFPLVEYDETGYPDGLRYDKMITYIVPLLQQQREDLELKTERIDRLEDEVAGLKRELEAIKQMILSGQTAPADQSTGNREGVAPEALPYLKQNVPNPFSEDSLIAYYIPEGIQKAELRISDAGGNVVRQFTIHNRGTGQTRLQANSLSDGIYFYYLILDGRIVDTRKMVLTGK